MAAFDDKAAPRRLPVALMVAASASILAAAHLLRSMRRKNVPRGQPRAGQRSRVAGRAATEEERRQQRAAAAEARLAVVGPAAGDVSGCGGGRSGGQENGRGAVAAAAGTRGERREGNADMEQGSRMGVPCGYTAGAAGALLDGGVGGHAVQGQAVGSPGWCDPRLTPYGQALLLTKEIDELEEDVRAWRAAASARTSQHTAAAPISQASRLVEGLGEAALEGTEVQNNDSSAEGERVWEKEEEKLQARMTRAAVALASIQPDVSVAPIRREQNARLFRINEVLVKATNLREDGAAPASAH